MYPPVSEKITISNLESSLIFLNKILKPKFPISGELLKEHGYESGEKLGKILKKMENQWISNDFALDQKTIDEFLKNKQ